MGRVLVKVSCWLGQKERNIVILFEWVLNTMFTVFFWSSKSCRSSSSYVCTSCVFSYMPNGSNIPFTVCISTSLHETNFLFSAWQSSHLFNLFKSLELQQPFVLVHTHTSFPPLKNFRGENPSCITSSMWCIIMVSWIATGHKNGLPNMAWIELLSNVSASWHHCHNLWQQPFKILFQDIFLWRAKNPFLSINSMKNSTIWFLARRFKQFKLIWNLG